MATNSTPEENQPDTDNRDEYELPPEAQVAEPCDPAVINDDGFEVSADVDTVAPR